MEWIKCSERLPENGKRALVYAENKCGIRGNNEIHVAEFVLTDHLEARWYVEAYDSCNAYDLVFAVKDVLSDNIVCWMPLPEPPKLDEK